MTDLEIVQMFEQYHFKTIEDMCMLGLNPVHIDTGSDRIVYRLGGLAIKISRWANFTQTKNEIRCIARINDDPELAKFIPHIPPLFYGDEINGVIVTEFYPMKVSWDDEGYFDLASSLGHVGIRDLHVGNFRKKPDGPIVAIDLGYYQSE